MSHRKLLEGDPFALCISNAPGEGQKKMGQMPSQGDSDESPVGLVSWRREKVGQRMLRKYPPVGRLVGG